MAWLNFTATTTVARLGKYTATATGSPGGAWTWEVLADSQRIGGGRAPKQHDAEMMAQRCVDDWLTHDESIAPTPQEDPPPATDNDRECVPSVAVGPSANGTTIEF